MEENEKKPDDDPASKAYRVKLLVDMGDVDHLLDFFAQMPGSGVASVTEDDTGEYKVEFTITGNNGDLLLDFCAQASPADLEVRMVHSAA